MSSQHEDYRIYHGTVNSQNRSNYEFKYQLIRQIPLGIIGISTVFNFLVQNNWLVALLSLGAIVFSLITYLLLYYLLESAISTNEQWEKIAAKNKSLPPDKQLEEEPADKKKYDGLNKYMRRAYTVSISLCIMLVLTIGVTQMSENKTKSQTTEAQETNERLGVVTKPLIPEGSNPDTMKKGIVTSPIVPEGSNPNSIDEGIVTSPIVPEGGNPDPATPTAEQPTGNEGGGQDNPPSTPETQNPESQPADESK